jgi:hypothetical protein
VYKDAVSLVVVLTRDMRRGRLAESMNEFKVFTEVNTLVVGVSTIMDTGVEL